MTRASPTSVTTTRLSRSAVNCLPRTRSRRVRRAVSSTGNPRRASRCRTSSSSASGSSRTADVNSLPLTIDVNGVTTNEVFGNDNGFLDPGETIRVRIPLDNYTINPLSAEDARKRDRRCWFRKLRASVVLQPFGDYGRIDSGETTAGDRDLPAAPAAGLRSRHTDQSAAADLRAIWRRRLIRARHAASHAVHRHAAGRPRC